MLPTRSATPPESTIGSVVRGGAGVRGCACGRVSTEAGSAHARRGALPSVSPPPDVARRLRRRDRNTQLRQELLDRRGAEDGIADHIVEVGLRARRTEQGRHRRADLAALTDVALGQDEQAEQLELLGVGDCRR